MTGNRFATSLAAFLAFAFLFAAAPVNDKVVADDVEAALKKIPADRLAELRRERARLNDSKKRLIFDNDGCDALYFPTNLETTKENFLSRRTTGLLGSDVTTVTYCPISAGFGLFTHDTKVGELLARSFNPDDKKLHNIAGKLIEQGSDVLRSVNDFCRENKLECFWNFRMNDTHDAATRPDKVYPLFPKLKQDHPELMVGSFEKKTPFGPWTSVNYGKAEIRDLAFQYTEEVCRNYDIDGFLLDFCRHLCYFPSVANGGVASSEEVAMMTDMIRRIRAMSEVEGVRRGRPILVAIRVPDDPEYAKAIGLDFETWMKEGLADFFIGSDYFQMKPWSNWVALGKKHGVRVYAGMSESRVQNTNRFKRLGIETYRARCAEAWHAGVDGIFIFNEYNAKAPFLRDVGSAEKLKGKDKLYFATPRDGEPNRYLKDGRRFRTMPILTPKAPWKLAAGKDQSLSLELVDQPTTDDGLKVTLHCQFADDTAAEDCAVVFNDKTLETGKAGANGWIDLSVPLASLKTGTNTIVFRAASKDLTLKDVVVQYDFAPFEKR